MTRAFLLSIVASLFLLMMGLLIPLHARAQSGYIYWTDSRAGNIQRAHLDGTGRINLVQAAFVSPLEIALDTNRGKLYWVDNGTQTIHRSNLDGSNVELFIDGLISPSGIALDRSNDKIYWNSGTQIHRSNLDGSNIASLVTLTGPFYSGIFDIALDTNGGKMYWAHGGK
ncbi:MAG: YncE family protein, partial [Rhodothermales bacterium]